MLYLFLLCLFLSRYPNQSGKMSTTYIISRDYQLYNCKLSIVYCDYGHKCISFNWPYYLHCFSYGRLGIGSIKIRMMSSHHWQTLNCICLNCVRNALIVSFHTFKTKNACLQGPYADNTYAYVYIFRMPLVICTMSSSYMRCWFYGFYASSYSTTTSFNVNTSHQ